MIVIVLDPHRVARAALPFFVAIITIAGLCPDWALPAAYNLDKFVHVAAFGILGFLSSAGYKEKRRALILVSLCLLAAAVENLQALIPGRDSTLDDAFAGLVGLGIGILAWFSLEKALGLDSAPASIQKK